MNLKMKNIILLIATIILFTGCTSTFVYNERSDDTKLKTAPAKFSELIADVISGFEGFVFAYLDDFLIYSETFEEHCKHLALLSDKLRQFGMFINLDKCQLAQHQVEFLGHTISGTGMSPLTSKVAAVMQRKRPTTLKELRSLLGSLNYYHSYVPHIAGMLGPLNDLLKGPRKGRKKSFCYKFG